VSNHQAADTGARPVALVTASCRGPGFDRLRDLCEVYYDPWIDQHPLRIWDGPQLAAKVDDDIRGPGPRAPLANMERKRAAVRAALERARARRAAAKTRSQ